MKKAPKIEYTPQMKEAMREMASLVIRLEKLSHDAGCKSMKIRVVWGKGGSMELEARREWDPSPLPYAAPAPERIIQPLARPTI